MAYWPYLLVPLYPVLAIVCLLVFAYERLALDEHFTAARIFFLTWNIISVIISCPALLLDVLCGCGALLRWPVIIVLSPLLLLWVLIQHFIWNPLFREAVPAGYQKWNNQVYQDLRLGPRQIRVLEILRGSPSSALHIAFRIIDIDSDVERHPYNALSYSWGGHLMLRRIITLNGRPFFVADTVFNALKELRLPDKERILWIDAVCINQGDMNEKRQQIDLMGSIYRRAQAVHVWLGKADAQSKNAFRLAENVASIQSSEVDHVRAEISITRPTLQTMMRSRWWSRVWIVQEVTLNDNVFIRWGHCQISWETFVTCLERLSRDPNHGLDSKVIGFVNTVSKLKRSDVDPKNGLLGLALQFRDRVAGRPQDKIIGFRGLLKSKTSDEILRHYGKLTRQFFAQCALYWIKETRNLGIVAIAENRATGDSWVLDWVAMTSGEWSEHDPLAFSEMDYKTPKDLTIDFWNGDLLPSISAMTGRRYSATQALPAEIDEKLESKISNEMDQPNDSTTTDRRSSATQSLLAQNRGEPGLKTLNLRGWQSDVVKDRGKHLNSLLNAVDVFRSWEKLAGGPWIDDMDTNRVRFIRTLLADTRHEILPQNWPDLFQQWVIKVNSGDSVLKSVIFPEDRDLEAAPSSAESRRGLHSMEQLIAMCCYNRCFFGIEQGRYGLGPAKINIGDRVCMLLGSDVPFILMHFGGKEYHFEGQAFVEGLMDYQGDLRNDMHTNRLETRTFPIE